MKQVISVLNISECLLLSFVINQIMSKKILILVTIISLSLAQCPSQNTIVNIETGSFTFLSSNVQSQLTSDQWTAQQFRYTPTIVFDKVPQVCIGINGIDGRRLSGNAFSIRVSSLNRNLMELSVNYFSNIWTRIQITFVLSSRDDVVLGTLNRQFNSLKGATNSLAINFGRPITTPNNAISRIFLNGYSLNNPSGQVTVEIYLTQKTITFNSLQINVATGQSFDLKTLWLSYVVFTPSNVPFGSFGQIFNRDNFQNSYSKNIIQNIGHLKYSIFGIMSLKVSQSVLPFSFSSEIDQNFIYTQSSTSNIDSISTAYLVFGVISSRACSTCRQRIEYKNSCLNDCPNGTFEMKFADGGSSCQSCSSKLNLKINSDQSACECITGYQFSAQSGKCQQNRQTGTFGFGSNLNSVEQINRQRITQDVSVSQNFIPVGPQNCGNNQYWTGFVCMCNPNFIEINNICIPLGQASFSDFVYQVPIIIYDEVTTVPQSCRNGEYLNPNTGKCQCLPELGKYQNICQTCPQSFYLTNLGECVDCPFNMQFSVQSQTCQCKRTFINQNGVCVCPTSSIQFGQTCIAIGGCSAVQIRLTNGTCVNCLANEISSNNICVCRPGFIRNNNSCIVNTTNCLNNQFLTNQGCKDCPDFSRYDQFSGQCKCILGLNQIVIRPGLFFCVNIGGSNCTQGKYFDLNQQICKDCHSTCRRCTDGDGKCLQCKNSSLKISGNLCQITIINPPPQGLCGNGILNGGEQCDDGNSQNLDGCSSLCKSESGFSCSNTVNRPTTVCTPQISIVLSEEPKSNQQNVFVNFRIFPIFNFSSREEERNFLKFTFPDASATPQTISCFRREPIKSPEIFNCLLSYPSGKPVNIFNVTTSWERDQKNATITFSVDPNQSINILNSIL